ncbi:hypothetical protein [Mastigocoleus testarum]|uniref:Lipase n=1 Tax=Mastigocoleus testarum BC008 TaxID=371196 RepID=A0A0V7ZBW2_9CYAN|nr:hypothetical protein [Mastigocoleus testarum]KST61991.1 hypothetical protein BC008_08135 [Mastigocoleus testarum BC008]
MNVIICPGMHEIDLTKSFISGLSDFNSDIFSCLSSVKILIYLGNNLKTLSAFHILNFLFEKIEDMKSPIIFIAFSAGVVGGLQAAYLWQFLGGRVKAFIAIDGWGVPLFGNFPIHTISHDYFTHQSLLRMPGGNNNFYAQPAVEHLEIWRSPQSVRGWWVNPNLTTKSTKIYLTVSEFLHMLLKHYEKISPENQLGKGE